MKNTPPPPPLSDEHLWPLRGLRLFGSLTNVMVNLLTLVAVLNGTSRSVGPFYVYYWPMKIEPPIQRGERLQRADQLKACILDPARTAPQLRAVLDPAWMCY